MDVDRTLTELSSDEQPRRRIDRRSAIRNTITWGAAAGLNLSCRPSWTADSASYSHSNLGLNLAPVRYFMTERVYENLGQVVSPYVSMREGGKWGEGGPLQRDEHGWLTGFEPGQHAAFVIDLGKGHPNTTYQLTFEGPADAVRIGRSRDNVTVTKNTDYMRVIVRVYKPIRNVVFHERGREPTQLFAAPFVQRCSRFNVLRFMDWLRTNQDRDVAWSGRVTSKHQTQAGNDVCVEHIAELCNQAAADLWYTIHHRAGDEYVRELALFLKSNLKPGIKVYLEHSNEAWNSIFPQHKYCVTQGNERFDHGGRSWLAYHVHRTAEIARTFRQAGLEVVSVLGLQSAGTWQPKFLRKIGLPDEIDAWAIAPYFGGQVGRNDELVQQARKGGFKFVFEHCRESIRARRHEVQYFKQMADRSGLQLFAYEAGQHLVAKGPHRKDKVLQELFVEANRSDEMYQLYKDYIKTWNEDTDSSLMCLFNSVAPWTESGNWGLLEYEGQPLSESPKFRAVVEFLGNLAPSNS